MRGPSKPVMRDFRILCDPPPARCERMDYLAGSSRTRLRRMRKRKGRHGYVYSPEGMLEWRVDARARRPSSPPHFGRHIVLPPREMRRFAVDARSPRGPRRHPRYPLVTNPPDLDARLPRDRNFVAHRRAMRSRRAHRTRTPARFAGRAPKKALFLAPKSILLHHSAGGWM